MADHDEPTEGQEQDLYDESPPRSIFAATWFRALLVLIVLGVIGAVAVPYILDVMNAPQKPTTVGKITPPSSPPPAETTAAPVAPPATTPPVASSAAPSSAATSVTSEAKEPVRPETATPAVPAAPAVKEATPRTPTKSAARPPAEKKPVRVAKAEQSTAATVAPRPKAAGTATKPTVDGDWWVQVGAFKDEQTARRLAEQLRGLNLNVEQSVRGGAPVKPTEAATTSSSPAASSGDRYDVFVSGASVADLNKRLAGKGLSGEASGTGAVVKPSLPLRDAVALSKDLATEGMKVQVRRAAGATTTAAAPPAPASTDTLYRVRVGGYPDRTAAAAALKDLQAKGYTGYLARSGQ